MSFVAARPGGERPFGERQLTVRHDPRGIEVVDGAEALTVPARRGASGTRTHGRHLRHADSAFGARQAAREEPVAPSNVLITTMSSARLSAISIDSASRRSSPDLSTSRSTTCRSCGSAGDPGECLPRPQLAVVDAHAREPALPQLGQLLLELPFRPRTIGARMLMRSSVG